MYSADDIQNRRETIESAQADIAYYNANKPNGYLDEIDKLQNIIQLNKSVVDEYELNKRSENIFNDTMKIVNVNRFDVTDCEDIIPLQSSEIIPVRSDIKQNNDLNIKNINPTLFQLLKQEPKDNLHKIWKYFYDFICEITDYVNNELVNISFLHTEFNIPDLTGANVIKAKLNIISQMEPIINARSKVQTLIIELIKELQYLYLTFEFAFKTEYYYVKNSSLVRNKKQYFPTLYVLTPNDQIVEKICQNYGQIPCWIEGSVGGSDSRIEPERMKLFSNITWDDINDEFFDRNTEKCIRERVHTLVQKINEIGIGLNVKTEKIKLQIELLKYKQTPNNDSDSESTVEKSLTLSSAVTEFIDKNKNEFINGVSSATTTELFIKTYPQFKIREFQKEIKNHCKYLRMIINGKRINAYKIE